MAVRNVDVVLVIDASPSMRPCLDQLRLHLRELIKPMQGYMDNVRFGMVSLTGAPHPLFCKGRKGVGPGPRYWITTLASNDGTASLQALYGKAPNQQELMTSDSGRVISSMDSIQIGSDEDNLLALDIALDHPFGPVSTTKRVVAIFADEPLETGIKGAATGQYIPALIEKIHQRRVKLFCALPYSDLAQELSQANGSEIETVDGGQGLSSVNFSALLTQMAKSISVSSQQSGPEERYQRALFGQDKWLSGIEPGQVRDNE